MTRKEMEAVQSSLPRRMDWANWTEEQKKLDAELSCREMINSCLCYSGIESFWHVDPWRWGEYKSYAARHVAALGMERVKEIVKEQEEDFARAVVLRNVHTDSEGCTYNSIRWADEQ